MQGFTYRHGDRPLDGYTVQRAVGRGGFGEVYYAVSDSGREVALKAVQGYEQIELRGTSQCMNLRSPHLVTIFDVRFNDNGKPFIIMEYVSGPSLRDLIDQSATSPHRSDDATTETRETTTPPSSGLGEQKAAFFLREIAKGLAFLHERGIVHRDLKPGNIFYQDGYVMIGDYGLSKAMTPSRHSGQTITVGTVHYMAPEIGQGCYDSSIDIYALGVVLYEMLTGQTPYLGSSPGEILMKHMMSEPDVSGIGSPFAATIRKAMARNVADRYHTVQEMVEDVFGAEHIRNSVSYFSPDTLSIVAEQAARTLRNGKEGSSGDVTRQLDDKGPRTATSDSDIGRANTSGKTTGDEEELSEFGRKIYSRVDKVGRRIGQVFSEEPSADEATERIRRARKKVGERLTAVGEKLDHIDETFDERLRTGRNPGQEHPGLQRRLDEEPDPVDWKQRRILALLTAMVMSIGTGILGAGFMAGSPLARSIDTSIFVFVAVCGLASGIYTTRFHWLKKLDPKDAGQHGWTMPRGASVRQPRYTTASVSALQQSGYTALLYHMAYGMIATIYGAMTSFLFLLINSGHEPKGLVGFIVAGVVAAMVAKYVFYWRTFHRDEQQAKRVAVASGLFIAIIVAISFTSLALRHMGVQSYALHSPSADVVDMFYRTMVAVGVTLFLVNWTKQMSASRRARVSFWRAMIGGAIALCLAMALRGDPAIAAGMLLTTSMCVQALAPYDPQARRRGHGHVHIHGQAYTHRHDETAADSGEHSQTHSTDSVGDTRESTHHPPADRTDSEPPDDMASLHPVEHDTAYAGISPRKRIWALLLACVLFPTGIVGGVHRLYCGRIVTGVIWLCTFGLLWIGQIVDIINIIRGRFTDRYGRRLVMWFDEKELSPGSFVQRRVKAQPTAPSDTTGSDAHDDHRRCVRDTLHAHEMSRSRDAHPNRYRPPQPGELLPARTNLLLSMVAGMFILAAIVVGMAMAFDVPGMVASGLLDDDLPRELEKGFGYAEWPRLVHRIADIVFWALVLGGATITIIARRKAGFWHVTKGLLGCGGLLLAVEGYKDQAKINWNTVADNLHSTGAGPAIESLLNQAFYDDLIIFALLFIGAIVILNWPEKRTPASAAHADTAGV